MIAALLVSFLAVASPGDAPLVHFTTKVVTKSWEPIDLPQVEKFVEAEVLQVLTKPGTMRLKKGGFADLKQGDYSLVINGRFIEEAERFSVYLTFGNGKREDLPSFHTTHTSEALGRKKRSEMQRLIREAASAAAARLVAVLTPQLEAARLRTDPPVLDAPELPLEWGAVEVPPVRSKNEAIRTLLNVRKPDHERHEALTAIKGFVFDQQPARNAVELCLLRDPSPKLRERCADVLKPVARNHPPTQRVILHAMRTDVDEHVIDALAEISQTFVGLSRLETIATWLHLIASDVTPVGGVSRMVRLLSKEGDVANLDYAVAACLQSEALVYGKKTACAGLLGQLPPPRRRAVVWRYLERVEAFGQGEVNVFERVADRVFRSGRRGDEEPALGALMLRIAARESAGRVRRKAVHLAGEHAPAIAGNLRTLVRFLYDQSLQSSALRAVERMVRRAPELTSLAVGALKQVRTKARYFKKPHSSDPYRELEKTIERLERRLSRKQRR